MPPAAPGSATFGSITRSIFGALQAMGEPQGGPFASVVRALTDKEPQGPRHQLAGVPALVFPAGEEKTAIGINTIGQHQVTYVVTTTWHVWIVARALAGVSEGGGVVPLEDLIDYVEARLPGLKIPGLYLNERLNYLGSFRTEMLRGTVRRGLAFATRHVIESPHDLDVVLHAFGGMDGKLFDAERLVLEDPVRVREP